MTTSAIDLFAGFGGFTAAAQAAGCQVLWAANHYPEAVDYHQRNHPDVDHHCQDLHQADWTAVPGHDLLLASPCCQGHSNARGRQKNNPQHDASRSTAWAVVSALEVHRAPYALVENVPGFLEWELYPAWAQALATLGYSIAPHTVDLSTLGAPQQRERLFLVLSRTHNPLWLDLPARDPQPVREIIDFDYERWSSVDKPGRSPATLARVQRGRAELGPRFIMPYYSSGSGLTGRSLDRPIGTITTRDRWAVVDDDRMRMLNKYELRAAMSFPDDYILPNQHKLAVQLLGNAVPPAPTTQIIEHLLAAA